MPIENKKARRHDIGGRKPHTFGGGERPADHSDRIAIVLLGKVRIRILRREKLSSKNIAAKKRAIPCQAIPLNVPTASISMETMHAGMVSNNSSFRAGESVTRVGLQGGTVAGRYEYAEKYLK